MGTAKVHILGMLAWQQCTAIQPSSPLQGVLISEKAPFIGRKVLLCQKYQEEACNLLHVGNLFPGGIVAHRQLGGAASELWHVAHQGEPLADAGQRRCNALQVALREDGLHPRKVSAQLRRLLHSKAGGYCLQVLMLSAAYHIHA